MTGGGALIASVFYALTLAVEAPESPALAVAYGVLFAAAGALCGWLTRFPVRAVRYVAGSAAIGAVLWSYFTAAWPFSAHSFAAYIPSPGVVEAVLLGAALGAAGGGLFFGLKTLQSAPPQVSEKEKTLS